VLFELEPLRGVGPLRLGMSIEDARAALAALGRVTRSCLLPHPYVIRDGGLSLSLYEQGGLLDGVRLEGPLYPDSPDQVRYRDIDVLCEPHQQVVDKLRRYTTLTAPHGSGFEAPELHMYVGCSWGVPEDAFDVAVLSVPDPDLP
jgi:hypothetical protein